jgi:nucleoside-diphosphate-sugar epimerase
MKTVAITGCNGSVGHHVVLYFLNQQHCNVLGIDVSPLVDSLTKVLADEVGLKVQNDRAGERFAFAKVDLKNWDDTLACLKAGIKSDGDQKQDQRIDGIVHLGAFKDPTDYVVQTHNTNVVVNYNVLRAAAEV